MKIQPILLILLVLSFAAAGFGQNVVITSKIVTYKRDKPFSDYKKSFTVNYPRVKASTPTLSKKITTIISYERVFSFFKLQDELNKSEWVDSADFEVIYNNNGVLCMSLSIDGSGAYPSGNTKFIVVNLKTGVRVWPGAVFTNQPGLLKMVTKAKNIEVSLAIADAKRIGENEATIEGIEMSFRESAKYHPIRLDQFSVSDKGITFHYDYEFAHVIQPFQPDGGFFFTWAQMKPYINRHGLLSKMLR